MPDIDGTSPLAAGQIEIWKKIIDVQQHFNDLELRIRNFAIVVTGAILGLGGYAIKDAGMINVWGVQLSVAGLIVFSAILPLLAFYFMDRLWYHRLLDGSVAAGIEAESALKAFGYKVDLGSKISAKSPFTLWMVGKQVHSKTKMDIFYGMLVVALIFVASCLGFGIRPQSPQNTESLPAKSQEIVRDLSTAVSNLAAAIEKAPNAASGATVVVKTADSASGPASGVGAQAPSKALPGSTGQDGVQKP